MSRPTDSQCLAANEHADCSYTIAVISRCAAVVLKDGAIDRHRWTKGDTRDTLQIDIAFYAELVMTLPSNTGGEPGKGKQAKGREGRKSMKEKEKEKGYCM